MIIQVYRCEECGTATLHPGPLLDVEGDGISETPDLGLCGIVRYSVPRQSQFRCTGRPLFIGYLSLVNLRFERERIEKANPEAAG